MLQKSLFGALLVGASLAAGSAMAQEATGELRIEGTVDNGCLVSNTSVTGLSFQGTAVSRNFSAAVGILCNAGTPYAVSPGPGLNFAEGSDPNKRHLADGAGNHIPYELFQGVGTEVWGEGGQAMSGVGTGDFVPHPFTISFYDLTMAPGGTYSDTVVTTVTYD